MRTQVLIIGGGVTGTGLARDLALRGVDCLLAEKRDINAGASGGNHGLLHSGVRYVVSDPASARQCRDEGEILRKTAPHCIEESGGLFVAMPGDDPEYLAEFPALCREAGLWARPLEPARARELEPVLSPEIIAAYEVKDAVVDPFRLSLDNLAHAASLGAQVRRNWRATAMGVDSGRVRTVSFVDETGEREVDVRADLVINAAGAWAGLVAALAGLKLDLICSKGTLLVTQSRLARRVINRLRPPSDADILVPAGTVSVLGTTSQRTDSPDRFRPTAAEADLIIDDARSMVPSLEEVRYIRAYAGVRALAASGQGGNDRMESRGFILKDHAAEGLANLISITGGKLTTFRLMAEKAADLACQKLGVAQPCQTRTRPLPPSDLGAGAEPGREARLRLERGRPDDPFLCECELVPQSAVDDLLPGLDDSAAPSLLEALGLRSRLGKGPCQGAFCGLRVLARLYDQGRFKGPDGLGQLAAFIERRWRGFAPVQWGESLAQAELQEALYAGALDLDLWPGRTPEEPR